jgi:hypothetical protein
MPLTFTAVDGSTVTPTTRADLMKHPAFADLQVDSDGNPCVWQNRYDSGAHIWESAWSCQCDDDGYEPFESDWLPTCTGWHEDGSPNDAAYWLWEALPEAPATYPTPISQPNYGDNDLRDSFTIHESEAEAQKTYDLLLAMGNTHCAAIAPIHKATEPYWQDQR